MATTQERPEGAQLLEREQRDERSRHRARDAENEAPAPAQHDLQCTAPVPLVPLDFSESSSSVEAQLLARGTFSLDIKSVDTGVVRVIW